MRDPYRAQAEAVVASLSEGYLPVNMPILTSGILVAKITDALSRCAAEAAAREREALPLGDFGHGRACASVRQILLWSDQQCDCGLDAAIRRRGEPEGGND